ncbi:MAG: hypothetical protein RLZZ165_934 [Bacteroidota bacterium]
MKIHFLLSLLGLASGQALFSQTDYFQQAVAYEIHVRLDDSSHYLRGDERLVYTNHAPVALDSLFIHLWPNAYRDEGSAFAKQQREQGSLEFHDSKPSERGFIDSLDFRVGGEAARWVNWKGNPDIAVLYLPSPIPPGGEVTVTTPFRVKIPSCFSRLGHVGQQYQISQWYPKPAVYDREGWHPMPYLDQGEFYGEFGTFDVFIEVPRNYVVGATGDLPPTDPEVDWLRERESKSRTLLHAPHSGAAWEMEFAPDAYKTLHFHQERVHDFAWFCDQQYYVLSDTVQLPGSGRAVRCVSMFTDSERGIWERSPEYIAQAIHYYSLWNGDYPYHHATAVQGALGAGAGMEYPNVTVLPASGTAENLELVTLHEVGHNWYYGILGSNEREHPWMDEGLNTYFEGRYWKELHHDELGMVPESIQERFGFDFTHSFMQREGYRLAAAQNTDQPVEGHAAQFTNQNYPTIVYWKTALAFSYLEAYLGREQIDSCFRAYFEQWKFRHPQPADLQAVFEEVSGRDLRWFFQGYLRGTEKVDFEIKHRAGNTFTIRNHAGIPLPASLSLLDEEGRAVATYWTAPFLRDTTVTVRETLFSGATINADGAIPEVKESNNGYRGGPFPHLRPVSLDFLYKFPSRDKFHLGLAPMVGYNTTDGFMGGAILYHHLFPERPFSFHLMPMFGFKSSRLVGSSGFSYRWLPSKLFRKVTLQVRLSSYSTYLRIRPGITFDLAKGDARSPFSHSFTLVSQILARRGQEAPLAPSDWYLPVYGAVRWNTQAHTLLSDFRLAAEAGGNLAEPVMRLSVESSYCRRLLKKMQASVRLFGGMLSSRTGAPYVLQYRVSGSGDPFGENILLDRAQASNWLSHQVVRDHGGFSSLTGRSFDRGLFAVNGNIRLPVKFISVFGDFAIGKSILNPVGAPSRYYDAGFRLNAFKEALQVNFPVLGTVFGGFPSSGKAWWQGVNFSIDPLKPIQALGGVFGG